MNAGARTRLLWLGWWGIWALITLPWDGLEAEPQWQRVGWGLFEFSGRRRAVLDAGLNLLIFVPFGLLGGHSKWRTGVTVGLAALVSFATEALQLFTVSRHPSTTDLLMNITGAAVGNLIVALRRR